MGAGGSDAAVETADVVLMTDSPMQVVNSIEVAKRTRKIVWQNIGLAMGVKLFFILLGAFGIATMWETVFGDMGVAIAAILNGMRVMRKDDRKMLYEIFICTSKNGGGSQSCSAVLLC